MASSSKLLGPNGKPFPKVAVRHDPAQIRAKYDAAQTVDENRRHWANADALSAKLANSLGVRVTLRNRAQYEIDNGCHAEGMIDGMANAIVGTGPRLQMQTEDRDVNRGVEKAFTQWARSISFAEKLRTGVRSKKGRGEAFYLRTTNEQLRSPVKLDLKEIECDQVTTPSLSFVDGVVDGLEFDSYGNVALYHVLRDHPGDSLSFGEAYDKVPARNVVHWFKRKRVGQARGIPEITPALPLFALLRRYILAELTAAETAALFAAIVKSNMPPSEDEAVTPFSTQEVERGLMTFLPSGYDISQLKAEHPNNNIDAFEYVICRQIGRTLQIPVSIVLGDSSKSNYSSGRLDHQQWVKGIRVERSHCEAVVLNPTFEAWLAEAMLLPGYLPAGLAVVDLDYRWHWDGFEHVDPQKEANADATELTSNTTTLSEIYAEKGQDWEDALRQRAKEMALMKELGLEMAPTQTPIGVMDEQEEMAQDAV